MRKISRLLREHIQLGKKLVAQSGLFYGGIKKNYKKFKKFTSAKRFLSGCISCKVQNIALELKSS